MAKSAALHAHSASCSNTGILRRTAVSVAVAACFSTGVALANPTHPTVVHGTATFNFAGNILNITNSHNAIINWGSFSIGINELTKFIQPSALSAVLNRVTGQDPSAILGALQSNGRVFLINPNGITFGAGAQVDVAGLVASTLNLSNDDFLNNRLRFTDGAGAGSVINQGSLTGGSVYLVGNAVSNEGLITSPNGEVVLAAGNSVELVNPGTPDLRVEVVAPDNEARNLGTITAEAGRIGIYAGLIKQSGVISADSAVAQGGRIMLKSTRSTTLETGSVTSARGTSGGEILALSGMADGVTAVSGKMDASAIASTSPGNGGFIETSAAEVQIADSAVITTAGSGDGQTGIWLIDPNDFVIAESGGDVTADMLTIALISNDIVITTAFAGDYYGGMIGNGVNGDILVNQPVSWNSGKSLTLTAERNVAVNQAITNTGTGGINLNAGWDGISSPSSPTLNGAYGGQILLNAPVSTAGNVSLRAYDSIIQGASGPVTAAGLQAVSQMSSVNLANPATSNVVGTVAGSAIGSFVFKNSGNLTIGSVGSSNGITVDPGNGMHSMINVAVTGGLLTVSQNVNAIGGDGIETDVGGNAVVSLASSGGITVNSASLGAYGGDAFSGGQATVTMNAGGALSVISSSVSAIGGSDGYGGAPGASTVTLKSAGALAASDSTISVGIGSGGDAKVMLQSTGGTVDVSNSTIQALGGDRNCCIPNTAGGSATLEMISAGMTTISNSNIRGQGGDGAEGGAGGAGTVTVTAGGGLSVSNTIIDASGGDATGSIGTRQGGAATLVLNATGGNVDIAATRGTAWAGNGMTDGSAVTAVASAGNITVSSNSGGSLGALSKDYAPGTTAVILGAVGDITLNNNAWLWSNGVMGIAGANVLLDNALRVEADGAVVVSASGNLDVLNGSQLIGGRLGTGNATIGVGGKLTVASNGLIRGNPDVVMSVLGTVNMNDGGIIEAGAPTTIHLTFPMLTGGGYFVNGIEGLVYDPLTHTGFVASGDPAVLGSTFLVTYGGTTPPVTVPTDTLIVAMGDSVTPPEPEKDKDVFDDIKKDKEKEAPVCR